MAHRPPPPVAPVKRGHDDKRLSFWRDFNRRDAIWTAVSATVACIAFTLTFYNDTWGSAKDYMTAFTAGFATEAVLNWAVLPMFLSYRERHITTTAAPPLQGAAGNQLVEAGKPGPSATADTNGSGELVTTH
jgi:hypothetical protein